LFFSFFFSWCNTLNAFVVSTTSVAKEASNRDTDGDGKDDGRTDDQKDDPNSGEARAVAEEAAVTRVAVASTGVYVAFSVNGGVGGRVDARA